MVNIEFSLENINKIIPDIINSFTSNIILLEGEMGSGKTTLVKAIAKHLGSKDEVTSPTFSLVNEYLLPGNKKIYHFDLYRLKTETEALDFGIEEYLYDSSSIVFIEWSEKIMNLLPENSQKIRIIVKNFKTRLLEIE